MLAEHIEPDSLEQFAKRSENETASLGYAYDYHSIMHYGNNYYSTSTAKTLVVSIQRIIFILFYCLYKALLLDSQARKKCAVAED